MQIIIFSGAGLSAESGIQTFRSGANGGLWANHNIEDICSAGCLETNRQGTIDFYNQRRNELSTKTPNKAHEELAKLQNAYPKQVHVITQNVDDLLERAGCLETLHLHGELVNLKCETCNFKFRIDYKNQDDKTHSCPSCKKVLRPDIIFFGEMAPAYAKFHQILAQCEVFVSIGTSSTVIDAAGIAANMTYSINCNIKKDPRDHLFNKNIYQKASIACHEIIKDCLNFLNC